MGVRTSSAGENIRKEARGKNLPCFRKAGANDGFGKFILTGIWEFGFAIIYFSFKKGMVSVLLIMFHCTCSVLSYIAANETPHKMLILKIANLNIIPNWQINCWFFITHFPRMYSSHRSPPTSNMNIEEKISREKTWVNLTILSPLQHFFSEFAFLYYY